MNEKDLKIQALLERVAQLTQQYENQIADYRVLVTQSNQQIQELQQRIDDLEAEDVQSEKPEEKS